MGWGVGVVLVGCWGGWLRWLEWGVRVVGVIRVEVGVVVWGIGVGSVGHWGRWGRVLG